jgi:hypothetical protein
MGARITRKGESQYGLVESKSYVIVWGEIKKILGIFSKAFGRFLCNVAACVMLDYFVNYVQALPILLGILNIKSSE